MTMRNRLLAPLTAATMLSAAALAGCGGSSDKAGGAQQPAPTVLTMVNALDSEELQKFAGEVTRISHGSMRIEQTTLWHKGDTHNESDLVRYVQAGKADLGVAPARAWHGLAVRSFDALIAPMAVDSL